MSALPAQRQTGATLVEADQWEADALAAIEDVRTPEAAEALLGRIKLADQAIRLSRLGAEREQRWGRVRLLAERRYGELLGPVEDKGGGRRTVSTPNSERVAQHQARAVAAVPEPVFEEYVEKEPQPTRAGLLRESMRTRGQLANQSGGTDAWATPQDFFDALDAEFNFTTDVCALDSSAKCERYFTPETDGLAQEWTGACWMNPPYGDEIKHWIRKAHESADAGALVACLVPARVDTGWWWDHCRHAEVRFLRGRLKFGDADTSAPFPSALVIFGRPAATAYWEWQA